MNELSSIEGCVYYQNIDLTKYTTFKLAAQGDLVEVQSVQALQKLLPLLAKNKRSYLVVGWGANQILPAQCTDLIVHLDFAFDSSYLETQRDEYVLPASLGINYLT